MIKLSFTFIHSFINLFIVCLKGMGFKKHRSYPTFKEDYNLVEMDKHIHTVKWIIKKAISELSQISKVWGAESLWAGYVELRGAGLYTKQALSFRREDSQDPSSQRQESTLGNKRQSILSEMKLSFCPFYSELHKIGQDSEKGCYGYLKQEQTLSKEVSCFLMKILLNMEIILSYSIIIPRPPPPPYRPHHHDYHHLCVSLHYYHHLYHHQPHHLHYVNSTTPSPSPPPPSSTSLSPPPSSPSSPLPSSPLSPLPSPPPPHHYFPYRSYHHHPTRQITQFWAKRLWKWVDFT